MYVFRSMSVYYVGCVGSGPIYNIARLKDRRLADMATCPMKLVARRGIRSRVASNPEKPIDQGT